ncbi:MAG TPA: hypothetical protein VK194_03670, partial [Candidatus Deferrimicrobium sp.]|nr:hypothetical protein [Candidatus Deferrimicrobium sp.]
RCTSNSSRVTRSSRRRPLRSASRKFADLLGDWHAVPFRLDPVMRGTVERACGRDMQLPPGRSALVIDARGAGVVTVRMDGANCEALQVTTTGQVVGAGAGWSGSGPDVVPAPNPSRLADVQDQLVEGGDLRVTGWSVLGRAGAGVAVVLVEPLGRPVVTATLENGWFGAWWPARPGDPAVDGLRNPPRVIRAYDALGTLLDEVRS